MKVKLSRVVNRLKGYKHNLLTISKDVRLNICKFLTKPELTKVSAVC